MAACTADQTTAGLLNDAATGFCIDPAVPAVVTPKEPVTPAGTAAVLVMKDWDTEIIAKETWCAIGKFIDHLIIIIYIYTDGRCQDRCKLINSNRICPDMISTGTISMTCGEIRNDVAETIIRECVMKTMCGQYFNDNSEGPTSKGYKVTCEAANESLWKVVGYISLVLSLVAAYF